MPNRETAVSLAQGQRTSKPPYSAGLSSKFNRFRAYREREVLKEAANLA